MSKQKNKWLILAIICLGGGVIYIFPYIQYTYYDSMMAALGFDNTQMGNIISIYGALNLVAYIIGGIIADKIHYKLLLSSSLIITGLTGFWFASFPSYGAMIFISIIWSITTIFTYWPAMIKAVKLLGSSNEQGRLFGFREAGFSLFGLLFASTGLFIFSQTKDNFKIVLIFYSIVYIICGILNQIFLPNNNEENKKENLKKNDLLEGIRYSLKQPGVWLAGLLIFFAYAVGTTLGRFAPYLTSVFKMGVSTAALISIITEYVIPNFGAITGGVVVDKVRSSSKVIMWGFVIMGILLGVFVALPGNPNIILVVIIVGLSIKLIQSALRGIYFVPIDEIKVPNSYVGTAVGIVSIIGFSSDAFLFSFWGRILDRFSAVTGYKIIFSSLILFCVAGLVVTWLLLKFINKRNAPLREEN